jgi:undecaprenyl-diphosphatase
MLAGGNSRTVAQAAAERLEEVGASLPPSIVAEPVLNRSALVNKTIATVAKNLTEGALLVIVVLFLLSQRKWLSSLLLTLGLVGGVLLSEGLKAVFERERPPAEAQAVETINASFPSGHALLATVFYLSIGVMLTRAFPRRRFKMFVLGVGIVLAILVGLTRIYLGAHWASDVFAGWAVGAAWAMALWLVAYAVARFQKARAAPLQDAPSPVDEAPSAGSAEALSKDRAT